MTAFVAFALYAVVVVLCLHAFVDCVRTPDSRVRHLPKAIWLLLMFMAPVLGGIAWRNLGKGPAQPSPQPAQHTRDCGGQTLAQV
ncbi:PLDc N-terminal domain-containing protein [Streptomyces sp. NRRL S-646]|uniref:PLDc N-terminal domain-containing protein n=1 Tax=Streptomyces sp. NRRL S-646 TaxID=1463917 RepID=UPI00068F25FC|nr:PLD nuclease N-terminal domain-containing protein [Streptomyces sp. NRRL S-646]